MVTDSLYLALAEKEQEDCIRPEMRANRRGSDQMTVSIVSLLMQWQISSQKNCVKHKQHEKREPGLFKEEFRCTEFLCLRSKTYCCYNVVSNKLKISSKLLNKRVLEQSGHGPLEKFRRGLNEKENVTLKNRGFRKNNNFVATFEQVNKNLSFFYPKQIVKSDEIHTQPLNL